MAGHAGAHGRRVRCLRLRRLVRAHRAQMMRGHAVPQARGDRRRRAFRLWGNRYCLGLAPWLDCLSNSLVPPGESGDTGHASVPKRSRSGTSRDRRGEDEAGLAAGRDGRSAFGREVDIVSDDDITYFLAGDATYTEADPRADRATLGK